MTIGMVAQTCVPAHTCAPAKASCSDCYFRRELLCALSEGPCPTFRPCGAEVVELAAGRFAHERAEPVDAVVDLAHARIAERQA